MKLWIKVAAIVGLMSMNCDSQETKELNLLKRGFEAEGTNRYVMARKIAESGERGVKWLIGHPRSMDGSLEKAIGVGLVYSEIDVFPFLERLLTGKETSKRVFAIQVSSHLMDDRYIPIYKELLHDREEIDGSGPEITISDYAQAALDKFQWRRDHPNCYRIHREALLGKAHAKE